MFMKYDNGYDIHIYVDIIYCIVLLITVHIFCCCPEFECLKYDRGEKKRRDGEKYKNI